MNGNLEQSYKMWVILQHEQSKAYTQPELTFSTISLTVAASDSKKSGL